MGSWEPKQPFSVLGWDWSLGAPVSIVPISAALGLMALVGVVRWEAHRRTIGRSAILDISLFGIATFSWGNVRALTVAMGEFGLIFVLPLFLVNGLGLSTLGAGVGTAGRDGAARHPRGAVRPGVRDAEHRTSVGIGARDGGAGHRARRRHGGVDSRTTPRRWVCQRDQSFPVRGCRFSWSSDWWPPAGSPSPPNVAAGHPPSELLWSIQRCGNVLGDGCVLRLAGSRPGHRAPRSLTPAEGHHHHVFHQGRDREQHRHRTPL